MLRSFRALAVAIAMTVALVLPSTALAAEGANLGTSAHLASQHLKLELPDTAFTNVVTVLYDDALKRYTISATELPDTNIDAGLCSMVGADLQCNMGVDGDTGIEIRGGSGDDSITVTSTAPVEFHGQAGINRLTGGSGDDFFVGSAGITDVQVFEGRGGVDKYFGDLGLEIVSYAGHSAGVNVSLDCVANDGNVTDDGSATENAGCATSSITHVEGSNFNDVLTGHPTNDDAEELNGHIGDDIIDGKAGNDTIFGEQGQDDITGGLGDDTIEGGDDDDFVLAGGGNDDIEGQMENDTLIGGSGTDTIYGDSGTDTIDGGPDNDTLWGGPDADDVTGGAGIDSINSEEGNDVVNTRDGEDDGFVLCGEGPGGVTDNSDADVLYADPAIKDSAPGCEQVFRATTTDGLIDVLSSSFIGADHLVVDTPSVGTASYNVSITSPAANQWNITFVEGNAASLLISDECDRPSATVVHCVVDPAAFAAGVEVWGGLGNSVATMLAPRPLYFHGETGTNFATGNSAADTFNGSTFSSTAAINTFEGNEGADTFIGGPGFDTAAYANHVSGVTATLDCSNNDGAMVDGVTARDNVGCASSGMDAITGSSLNDQLTGDSAGNYLYGNGGDDTIRGLGGDDTLKGFAGNDTIEGDTGTDLLWGGVGNDTLTGGADPDRVYGDTQGDASHIGNDTINQLDGVADIALDCGGPAGSDSDTATLDKVGIDTSINCENVTQAPADPPPAPPAEPTPTNPVKPQPSPETVVANLQTTTRVVTVPDWVGFSITTVDELTPVFEGTVVYDKHDIVFTPKNKLPKNPQDEVWKPGMVMGQTPAGGSETTISAGKPMRLKLKVWGGPTKDQCIAEAKAFVGVEFVDFQKFMLDIGCKIEDVHAEFVKSTTKPKEEDATSGERCEVGAITKPLGSSGKWLDATIRVPRDPALQDIRLSVGNSPSSGYPGLTAEDWGLTSNVFNAGVLVRAQSRTGDPMNGVTLYWDMSGVSSANDDKSFQGFTTNHAKYGNGAFVMPPTSISKAGAIEVLAVFQAKGANGATQSVCGTATINVFKRGNGAKFKLLKGDYIDTMDGRRFTYDGDTKMTLSGLVPVKAGKSRSANARGLFDPIVNFFASLFGPKSDAGSGTATPSKVNKLANDGVILMQFAMNKPINANAPVATLVAAGGGNLVAAGGGNLVAAGGLNVQGGRLVAAGGGNLVAAGAGNAVYATNGKGGLVAAGGGNLVAAGGGNMGNAVIDKGNATVYSVGGIGLVAAGGGNLVAAGGGNLVAAGGGNLVGPDGGT